MTEVNEDVILSVHNAFPYMYIPYLGPTDVAGSDSYIDGLISDIDSFPSLRTRGGLVISAKIVKRIPFYGYHPDYEKFVKIRYCQPWKKEQLRSALSSGHIRIRVMNVRSHNSQSLPKVRSF